MKTSTKIIIAVAAVVIIGGLIGYYYWNKSKSAAAAQPAATPVNPNPGMNFPAPTHFIIPGDTVLTQSANPAPKKVLQ